MEDLSLSLPCASAPPPAPPSSPLLQYAFDFSLFFSLMEARVLPSLAYLFLNRPSFYALSPLVFSLSFFQICFSFNLLPTHPFASWSSLFLLSGPTHFPLLLNRKFYISLITFYITSVASVLTIYLLFYLHGTTPIQLCEPICS